MFRRSGGAVIGEGTWSCNHQWPVPLDPAEVAAVRLGEAEIPIP